MNKNCKEVKNMESNNSNAYENALNVVVGVLKGRLNQQSINQFNEGLQMFSLLGVSISKEFLRNEIKADFKKSNLSNKLRSLTERANIPLRTENKYSTTLNVSKGQTCKAKTKRVLSFLN